MEVNVAQTARRKDCFLGEDGEDFAARLIEHVGAHACGRAVDIKRLD